MDPHRNLDDHDRERALSHQLDRLAPSRRDRWPKDDRRSSERMDADGRDPLTRSEREARWPIG
jgi:hypothetical protein